MRDIRLVVVNESDPVVDGDIVRDDDVGVAIQDFVGSE